MSSNPTATATVSRFERFPFLLIGLLALAHAALAIASMAHKSTTADELAHLTGGYTLDHFNDHRIHPENGALPQRWFALPLVFSSTVFPSLESEDWANSVTFMTSYRFFYESGNEPAWMLRSGRAMNALFGIGVILLVAGGAGYFWGRWGAVVAAAFCAASPTVLAHSALATSDLAMTFFLTASVATYWWHLHDRRPAVLALSTVIFGLACIAKFTAVLIPPMMIVMALIRCVSGPTLRLGRFEFQRPAARLAAAAVTTTLHGVAAVLVIWACYGFRYSAFAPNLPSGAFNPDWSAVLGTGGLIPSVINVCRNGHLLPEGFLYGFAQVLYFAEARGAFLDGQLATRGWVEFFPKAFLYKSTPAELLAITLAAAVVAWATAKHRAASLRRWYQAAPLLVLFVTYWAFSLSSHLNIGHRHILPIYPSLFMLMGGLGWLLTRAKASSSVGRLNPIWLLTIVILVGSQIAATARSFPHYLAYFSPIVGGSAHGYEHLVDSSLDWGQDLPGLARWLQANHTDPTPVFLSYFGTGEPSAYGINAVLLPRLPTFRKARPWYQLEPGIYAISATMLQHVYAPQYTPWTPAAETTYQSLRPLDSVFPTLAGDPAAHPEQLGEATPQQWTDAWKIYEELRFSRLCEYLRARKPDVMIGYSILVYRLDQTELHAAIDTDLRDFAAALEAAAQTPREPDAY